MLADITIKGVQKNQRAWHAWCMVEMPGTEQARDCGVIDLRRTNRNLPVPGRMVYHELPHPVILRCSSKPPEPQRWLVLPLIKNLTKRRGCIDLMRVTKVHWSHGTFRAKENGQQPKSVVIPFWTAAQSERLRRLIHGFIGSKEAH